MKECQRPHPFERKWPESFGNEGVEASRSLGKDEVPSSNLGSSSKKKHLLCAGASFFKFLVEVEMLGAKVLPHCVRSRFLLVFKVYG